MAIITLLTDFGIADEYVGVMKGVILSLNPSVNIIDITHQIDPQDILHAAYTIKSSYKYFPPGTIHILVVDPGVGSRRAIIALKADNHIFLAPDNGLLSLIIDKAEENLIISIDNPKYFLNQVSKTFHGRDIFAPVAAHISKGISLKNIGTPVNKNELTYLNMIKPFILSNTIKGSIISIDRFGNLITNIDYNLIKKLKTSENIKIILHNKKICGLSKNYKSTNMKSPLAIIGSNGYLEISVNCGNAEKYFGAEKGDKIKICTD